MVLLARGSNKIMSSMFGSNGSPSHYHSKNRSCTSSKASKQFRKILKRAPKSAQGHLTFKWRNNQKGYDYKTQFDPKGFEKSINFTEVTQAFTGMKECKYWIPFEKKGCCESKFWFLFFILDWPFYVLLIIWVAVVVTSAVLIKDEQIILFSGIFFVLLF